MKHASNVRVNYYTKNITVKFADFKETNQIELLLGNVKLKKLVFYYE